MTHLKARGIVKSYGSVRALRGVDFEARPGAVNVLIGENGAGKSTLMKILAGVERHDQGTLLLDGTEHHFESVGAASAAGVGIVHQELNLCPNLSVAENIFLGRPRLRGAAVDREAESVEASSLLARLGARISPDKLVGDLRIGEQQLVEIARAMSEDASVLILDEPTSALSAAETESLFGVIDELRKSGVAIIYISHRLEELIRIGDYVTILRDGSLVAEAAMADVNVDWIIEMMLGEARDTRRVGAAPQPGPVVLELGAVTALRDDGTGGLEDVSISFRAGEVTALYGLLGAGRSEMFEAICGARPSTGSIMLDTVDLSRMAIHNRLRAGIQMVPEDRQSEGLFPNLGVGSNMSMAFLERLARTGLIARSMEGRRIAEMIERMRVKTASAKQAIGTLSGGNQQKVLIGRALMPGPRVLLLDEPGRGVDIGARADIFARIRALAEEGIAVIFSTSDLDEALSGDRIVVMADGRVTGDFVAAQANRSILVKAANATPANGAQAA